MSKKKICVMDIINFSITLSLIHIVYYFYVGYAYEIFNIGTIHNTPNRLINELRTEYSVMIKTFQRNGPRLGQARFKTIYLNENLFKMPNMLKKTFFHEYYHLKHKHKAKTLLMRLLLSLMPLLLIHSWYLFAVCYVPWVFVIDYYRKQFEINAVNYANQTIKNELEPERHRTKAKAG